MVLSLIHRRDWKDYSVYKKGFILLLFSIFPYRTWKRFSTSVIKSLELTNVNVCNDKALLDFIFELKYKRCSHLLMTFREMINIYRMVSKTDNLNGDIAEVGVFRGGSAAIMAHFKGNRHLHLFDTFEGLPEVNKDKDLLVKGEMSNAPEQMVRELLKDYQNWHIYKGIFPGTSDPIKNKVFSFVHLDVDLYEGTLFSLQFFYPRMQQGGIILVHDYSDLLTPGVKDALKEFFADKSEKIIEIWDTHACIVKQ